MDLQNPTAKALLNPTLYHGAVGIHTFQMNIRLNGLNQFKEVRDLIFSLEGDSAFGPVHTWANREVSYGEAYESHLGNAIRLSLTSQPYPWLSAVVNPRTLIGDGDLLGNAALSTEECFTLKESLDTIWAQAGFPFQTADFTLSRVDFCANLSFQISGVTRMLIKALNKTPWKKTFSALRFPDDTDENRQRNAHSFLICTQEEYIKVYDKKFEQFQRGNAVPTELIDLLRLEVGLSRPAIQDVLLEYTGQSSLPKDIAVQLSVLFKFAGEIMIRKLEKVFPDGVYVPYDLLQTQIKKSAYIREIKEEMIDIAQSLHRCRVAGNARERIIRMLYPFHRKPEKHYRELMNRFEALGLQPTPIAKDDYPFLLNPAHFLQNAIENSECAA